MRLIPLSLALVFGMAAHLAAEPYAVRVNAF